MGQFTSRPEEPTEWAGLPSEPRESTPAVESLAAPIDSAGSLGLLGGAVESLAIPLAPTGEIGGPTGSPESDPPD